MSGMPDNTFDAVISQMMNIGRSFRTLSNKTQIVFLIMTVSLFCLLNSVVKLQTQRDEVEPVSNSFVKDTFELQNVIEEHHVEKFSNDVEHFNDFKSSCYKNRKPENIEDLIIFVTLLKRNKQTLCQQQYKLFQSMYQIRLKSTTVVISKTFMEKVKKWLNDNEALIEAAKNQSLIFIDNRYTLESVVFNPVRANRPGVSGGATKKYIEELSKKTSKDCDFCNYKKYTAADAFGYMESSRSVIISNMFKIDRYHGMILFKNHDPIQFSQVQFIDSVHLTLQWFQRTHQLVPSHEYRIIYWDILPKASASQFHPHLHLTLGDYAYYAKWHNLYQSGIRFSREHRHKNYWKNMLQVHSALGLTVRFGKATVMAYLTPQKDFEVIVISEKPCLDFFRLAFFTIRTFIDDLEQYALSMGFIFPKLNTNFAYGDELPMMVRIVSRGAADSSRSDISSFDLFGTPNVNKDPFKIIQLIRDSVEIKKKEKFKFPQWKD